MTSLASPTPSTSIALRRPPRVGRPRTSRRWTFALRVVTVLVHLIRPLLLAGGIVAAAMLWPAHARADTSPMLNGVGIGNDGPISQAIAQIGTSMCPLLVKPGSQVVSGATDATGHGGLTSQIAGGVAGMVIQSQCPAMMQRLANGDFTVLTNAAGMLGMPTTGLPTSGVPGLPTTGVPGLPTGVPGLPTTGLPGLPS